MAELTPEQIKAGEEYTKRLNTPGTSYEMANAGITAPPLPTAGSLVPGTSSVIGSGPTDQTIWGAYGDSRGRTPTGSQTTDTFSDPQTGETYTFKDYNRDGVVDEYDFSLAMFNWGRPGYPGGDLGQDLSGPSSINKLTTGMGSVRGDYGNMGIGGISDAAASVAGMQERINAEMQANQDAMAAKREADKLQAQQDKGAGNIFSWLNSQPSIEQTREQKFAETGISPESYFAQQRAGIAEINSLTQDYNAVVAARDQQIAGTMDKMASMNFINNQVAQINRNAAPLLNQKSANINAKAATLQALQGNFSEAQRFVSQAVDDITADRKNTLDNFKLFYEINQDSIDRLDSKYQTALERSTKNAEIIYNREYAEKTEVGNLMVANPKAGITIEDTLTEAQTKIARSGGTASYQLQLRQENRLGSEREPLTESVDTYAEAYLNGEVEVTNIPEKFRAAAIKKANDIAKAALAKANEPGPVVPTVPGRPLVGGATKKTIDTLKENWTPERGVVGTFWNSLFGQ